MRLSPCALFFVFFFSTAFLTAECVNDYRSNKNAGILITDFTITGTRTIGATELAGISSNFIGSCFDENLEESGERIRAAFQDHGYFAVKVNSVEFKPGDPLGVPKPGTLEAEISDGPRYKLGAVTFVDNHAFSSEKLRKQFPLKRGDRFERGKVANGLESLRKLYGTQGFLDFVSIPETRLATNGTGSLNISIREGTQYHMGKLEIVVGKELAARLGAEWKLAEGGVYDTTYIEQYVEANRDLLPAGFSRGDVHTIQNCPDAVVEVRLMIDPAEDTSHGEPKNVPCEEHRDVSK